jgi:hypothetical protein
VADVLCNPPFAEFVEKCRFRWKRPLPGSCRRFGKTAAERPHFKTVTVRERPVAAVELRAANGSNAAAVIGNANSIGFERPVLE